MPSLPIRPPVITIRSPGNTCFTARVTQHLARHYAAGAAVDERFAQIAVIKNQGAVHRGIRSCSPVLNALAHAFINAAG